MFVPFHGEKGTHGTDGTGKSTGIRVLFCSVPPPVRNKRNKWNRKVNPEQRYGRLSLEIVDRACSKCSACSIPLVERNNGLPVLVIQLVVQEGNDGFEVIFEIFDTGFLGGVLLFKLGNPLLKAVNGGSQLCYFFLLVGFAILPGAIVTRCKQDGYCEKQEYGKS